MYCRAEWISTWYTPPRLLDVPWKDLQAAFRARGCVYLYVNPARAFLLPDGQADAAPDELWAYLEKHMGAKAKAL